MELNREEIIKALECCVSSTGGDACVGCPFNEDDICDKDTNALEKSALALVKKLTEEVNGLKAIAEGYQKQFEDCAEDKAKLIEENERLHASCTELTQCCTKLETLYKIECKRVDTVKTDTVRKMQEKVEQAICDNTYPDFDKDGKPVNVWKAITGYDAIDQIAKEMLEGDEGK